MYCQGGRLPPVTMSGFWSKAEIYPQPDTVVAAACDHRNVRGVCVGFPQVRACTIADSAERVGRMSLKLNARAPRTAPRAPRP